MEEVYYNDILMGYIVYSPKYESYFVFDKYMDRYDNYSFASKNEAINFLRG